jgi:hypothetical protein
VHRCGLMNVSYIIVGTLWIALVAKLWGVW